MIVFFKFAVPPCIRLPDEQACKIFSPRQLFHLGVESFPILRLEIVVRRIVQSPLLHLALEDSLFLCRMMARLASVRPDHVDS